MLAKLTPREQTVRDMLCRGLQSKEIGRELGISNRTVDTYRVSVLRKYGVNNVVKLVHRVLAEQGLLQ